MIKCVVCIVYPVKRLMPVRHEHKERKKKQANPPTNADLEPVKKQNCNTKIERRW